jgi:regulatory protein
LSSVITKIERQTRRPKRVSVFVDGVFAFGADQEVVAELGLGIDKEIEPDVLRKAVEKEEERKVREKALRYLSFRNRSVKELKDFLLGKGYDPGIVSHTLTRLEGVGGRLLEQELRQKGIKTEIIREVKEGLGDEEERALTLARARLERMKGLGEETAKRRLVGFLRRRGFSGETVYEVVRKALGLRD